MRRPRFRSAISARAGSAAGPPTAAAPPGLGDAAHPPEREAAFAVLLRHTPFAATLSRCSDGRLVEVNPAFERLFGWSREEAVGRTTLELGIQPDAAIRQRLLAELQAGRPVRDCAVMLHTRAGERRAFLLNVDALEIGGERFLINLASDVTDRQRAEAALLESETKFSTLFERAPFAAVLAELPDGVIVEANASCEQLLGYPRAELIGQTSLALNLYPDPAIRQELLGELSAGRPVHDREITARRRSGELRTVLVNLDPVAIGDRCYLLSSALDVTDRRRTEDELYRSREQLRALTQRLQAAREDEARRIARDLHDELGQSLTALKLDLRWLERELDVCGPCAGANPLLEKVVAAGELVDAAVRTVQRVAAELRPALLDRLGLAMALRHEGQQLERRTGLSCRLLLPAAEPQMPPAAALACYRICQEALTNVARHAAAHAVEIELRRAGTPPAAGVAEAGAEAMAGGPPAERAAMPAGGRADAEEGTGWLLEVRDDGRGIADTALADAGSLGLLGMAERARQLGGEVTVLRRPEGGTTVRVWLPAG